MGFTFLKKLPTPAEIRNQYPIDAAIQELESKKRSELCLQFYPALYADEEDNHKQHLRYRQNMDR